MITNLIIAAPPPPPAAHGALAGARLPDRFLLRGRTILIVEDEAMVAFDTQLGLEDRGASVVGPCLSLAEADEALSEAERLDAAVLDINIGGDAVFPLARHLAAAGVPFVFQTGNADMPELQTEFAGRPVCGKPVDIDDLSAAIAALF